jgi:hypothetical protein
VTQPFEVRYYEFRQIAQRDPTPNIWMNFLREASQVV